MISAYIVKENVTDYFLDILNNKRNMNRAREPAQLMVGKLKILLN